MEGLQTALNQGTADPPQLQAEVERNTSAVQAAETATAAAAKPGDGGGPFMCVSCAAQKSVAARAELDQRQGALLREREELLATMEKAEAAIIEALKGDQAREVQASMEQVAQEHYSKKIEPKSVQLAQQEPTTSLRQAPHRRHR